MKKQKPRELRHGEKPIFIPSYEKEPIENMKFIMSYEYSRMWINERDFFLKEHQTVEERMALESPIKRRHIQKMMTYRKSRDIPIIKLKMFQNIPGKCDCRREGDVPKQQKVEDTKAVLDYTKIKYMPACPLNNV